ncbi:MAG TPA: hypothetical protein VEB20_18010 [Azospirillaceae bacterium]|nr:hypothetical protein [Azospirillaceae bacterium]
MERRHLAVVVVALSVANGIFSPWVAIPFHLAPVWLPGFLLGSASTIFYASTLLLAALTILASGVPAALYERATGARDSTEASMWIWVAGAFLLSLPALARLAAL